MRDHAPPRRWRGPLSHYNMNYWIIINETEQGPFTVEQLRDMNLAGETPAWCEGMTDWVPASQIAELAAIIVPAVPVETPPVPVVPQVPPVPSDDNAVMPEQACPPVPEAQAPVMQTATHEPQPAQVIYAPANAIPAGYVAVVKDDTKYPPTYLFWAIFSTIAFFLPLGVCAIICSVKTKGHARAGRFDKASRMSERTALFVILSLVAWLIWMPFSVVFAMF